MKKLLRIIITLILTISILPISAMAETTFKDVSPDDWFYDNVNTAVEYGLMNGVSETEFAPDDKVTFGMAITLASRIHSIYMNDGEKFEYTEGGWAKPYFDYAIKEGIIGEEGYEDLTQLELYDEVGNQTACRLDISNIFSKSLPPEALKEINTIEYGAIPDMVYDIIDFEDEGIDTGVYTLYRAGVFAGSDEKGSFNPYEPITRAEIAAIASRMLDENLRQKLSLKSDTYERLKNKSVKGYASDKELVDDYLNCLKNKKVSQRFIDAFDSIAYSAYYMEQDIAGIRWEQAYEALLNFDEGAEYIKKNFPEIARLYEKEKGKTFNDDVLSYYLFRPFYMDGDMARDLNLSINEKYSMDIREGCAAYIEWMGGKPESADLRFNRDNIRQSTGDSEYYYPAGGFTYLTDYWMEVGIEYFIYNGEYRWFWPRMVLY